MSASSATTIKLPHALRKRLGGLARRTGRSAHSLMLEAIERHVDYEERLRSFVEEALAADRAIDEGGEVYRAAEVHLWIERLAAGAKAGRPKPWRR
jgi:predicted transcriptional regulator